MISSGVVRGLFGKWPKKPRFSEEESNKPRTKPEQNPFCGAFFLVLRKTVKLGDLNFLDLKLNSFGYF